VQPLGEGIPFTFLPNLVIGLRVYALYGRNKWIGIILSTYFIAELGVALWIYLVPSLHPVPLPASASNDTIAVLHLCLATVSTSLSQLQAAAFQFMQTIFDSVAFGLIVYKTLKDALETRGTDTIRTVIAKHGLVYYCRLHYKFHVGNDDHIFPAWSPICLRCSNAYVGLRIGQQDDIITARI